jgi:TetR/AcrR family acrAB operon transcriptional repressor
MARKTKVEAEETHQRILRAALDVFAAEGYERATFEDVAHRIRLTKGAVYWHFKNKPELLCELVAHMSSLQADLLSRALPPSPVSLDGLVAHFVERARLVSDSPLHLKYLRLMIGLDWSAKRITPIKRYH